MPRAMRLLVVAVVAAGGAAFAAAPTSRRTACASDADCTLVTRYALNPYGQASCCPETTCDPEAVNLAAKAGETAERETRCAKKDYVCPRMEQCIHQAWEAICEKGRCALADAAVELDKRSYAPDEAIAIRLRNDGEEDRVFTRIAVERLAASRWVAAKLDIACPGCAQPCPPKPITVPRRQARTVAWSQEADLGRLDGPCTKPAPGTFRIAAQYQDLNGKPGSARAGRTLHSVPFTVGR